MGQTLALQFPEETQVFSIGDGISRDASLASSLPLCFLLARSALVPGTGWDGARMDVPARARPVQPSTGTCSWVSSQLCCSIQLLHSQPCSAVGRSGPCPLLSVRNCWESSERYPCPHIRCWFPGDGELVMSWPRPGIKCL